MRLRIRHVTGFSYDGAADSSYNEVRMTPLSLPRQRVESTSLAITPYALQSTYRDYFDTIVTTFDLHEGHERLEVVADATVETLGERHDDERDRSMLLDPSWSDEYVEYLAPTSHTMLSRKVLGEFREMTGPMRDVRSLVDAALEVVSQRLEYVRGATQVTTTAQDAWDEGKGVCQDITHVMLALVRSVGVPARYVSGYLHPQPDAEVGETVVGESHAWVEYFAGEWRGVDPTNAGTVGLGHVTVARGREYGDVPPLKGIYHGGPASSLGVTVEVTRLS
jgi:transglutaminase-like putative cysteine protease